ncbi:hypothetical protein HMPREF7215_1509 [Pyramidobacter piscolens W5455]|uniref:Uncharacterized protein n=1 Tax=Pyramidobacter piscolens W5455 TaxID=352165 RepID=A0ABM9ZSS2_9BACT|nr:hypothetical protein HMPREF7215_1509 [Pyramidobacter piscolens W5455]
MRNKGVRRKISPVDALVFCRRALQKTFPAKSPAFHVEHFL